MVTRDPLCSERVSIRWAYDVADPSVPGTGSGANDWYCERTWQEMAHMVPGRNRIEYQKVLGKDKTEHTKFMDRRANFIKKQTEKAQATKRRGLCLV